MNSSKIHQIASREHYNTTGRHSACAGDVTTKASEPSMCLDVDELGPELDRQAHVSPYLSNSWVGCKIERSFSKLSEMLLGVIDLESTISKAT